MSYCLWNHKYIPKIIMYVRLKTLSMLEVHIGVICNPAFQRMMVCIGKQCDAYTCAL